MVFCLFVTFASVSPKEGLSVILNISQQMAKTSGTWETIARPSAAGVESQRDEAGKFVCSGTGMPRVS